MENAFDSERASNGIKLSPFSGGRERLKRVLVAAEGIEIIFSHIFGSRIKPNAIPILAGIPKWIEFDSPLLSNRAKNDAVAFFGTLARSLCHSKSLQ